MENNQTPPEATPVEQTPPTQPVQPQTVPTKPGPGGKAIAALVCGILSLICCGFFAGIPAIIIGKQEMNAIKKGQSNKEGFTLAQVGFILGIVGTALTCLGTLLYLLLIIFGVSMGMMDGMQGGM